MNFVRARRTAGVSLMLSSLVVGLLMAPSAVAAEPEVPENLEEVEPTRRAFWNADQSKYANNAATREFPPQAVCLVEPRACFFPEGEGQDPSSELPTGQFDPFADNPDTEEQEQGEDGLGALGNSASSEVRRQEQELLATMAERDDGTEPADPVPAESYPVSVAFGQPYYRSAVEFELPPLPDGEIVDSFTMVLTQGSPTYANESPAFRQAVLAALTCAQENPETPVIERCTIEEFQKVDPEQLSDGSHLNVEVCPIVGDWEAGESQDEDTLPEVDCLYTAAGQPVDVEVDGEEVTLWLFDLTFTAQAWHDGDLPRKGVLLRPGAAENFAYGDPETTYSKQVTFEPTVQIAMATSPEPEPAPPPAAPSSTGGFSNTFGSGGAFTPPSGSTGSVGMPSGSSTPTQPAVSQEPTQPAEQPAVAEGEDQSTLAAGAPLGTPEDPWWIWLLVPTFLAGAWLLSRSLAEEAVLATQRSGAMTRLLERRGAAGASELVTG